jgi:hypothetical protein
LLAGEATIGVQPDSTVLTGDHLTAEARVCPRCSSTMVLRTAGRGRYEGQQFWGCSTYPKCRGTIAIAEDPPEHAAKSVASAAGGSAQAEFETRKRRRAERIKQTWPVAVGITLVTMLVAYLVTQAYLGPAMGSVAASAVALVFMGAYLEVPQTLDAWRIGAEGERKTARYLDGLAEAGFIVLHDRKVPEYGGNLDHVAIGPTGVWAIETKNVAGKVEIDGDSLRIRGYRQDKMVDQVYREATAVQVALGTSLARLGLKVTPVICLHRGELPWFNKTVRGVRLASGRQLVRLLRGGEARINPEDIRALAAEADRLLRPAARG